MAKPRKKKGGRTTPPQQRRNVPAPAAMQPGKRPSNPAFLAVLAVLWIGCGVYVLVALDASWKVIPGIVFIGIGILFLRGAAVTVIRRQERS